MKFQLSEGNYCQSNCRFLKARYRNNYYFIIFEYVEYVWWYTLTFHYRINLLELITVKHTKPLAIQTLFIKFIILLTRMWFLVNKYTTKKLKNKYKLIQLQHTNKQKYTNLLNFYTLHVNITVLIRQQYSWYSFVNFVKFWIFKKVCSIHI